MKTSTEISNHVDEVIQASTIPAIINGGVYKSSQPTDSESEDCIIHVMAAGTTKFLQDGMVTVKIFVKDVFINNTYYPDAVRVATMEEALFDLSEMLQTSSTVSFDVESREIYTEKVPDSTRHYSILKMNYKTVI